MRQSQFDFISLDHLGHTRIGITPEGLEKILKKRRGLFVNYGDGIECSRCNERQVSVSLHVQTLYRATWSNRHLMFTLESFGEMYSFRTCMCKNCDSSLPFLGYLIILPKLEYVYDNQLTPRSEIVWQPQHQRG